jgi:hypothetical protein
VEIEVLKTKELVKQHMRYLHFVFHLGRGVIRKVGRLGANLVEENLGYIGPFTTEIAAYRAAKERNLKLGMGALELENYMTGVREDKCTGNKVPLVVPIVLHLVSNIITSSARVQFLHWIGCACFAMQATQT